MDKDTSIASPGVIRFSQFADFVNGFSGERPGHQRLGQWAFNLLWSLHPGIADSIRGTDSDPFYVDAKMPDFLRRLLDFVEMDDTGRKTQ